MQLYVFIYFFVILFFVIHHKICVFNIFISFFVKVSKFWNRLLHCIKIVGIRSYSCPHFLYIFPHSDRIRSDTPYLSVFSSNAGKCGKNADQNNSEYRLFLRIVNQSETIRNCDKKLSVNCMNLIILC